MYVTIKIDDELLGRAQLFTGISDHTALVHEGLTRLVQREAARHLAALGGSDPDAKAVPRRRPSSDPAALLPAQRLNIGSEMHRIAAEIGGLDDLETSLDRSGIKGPDLA